MSTRQAGLERDHDDYKCKYSAVNSQVTDLQVRITCLFFASSLLYAPTFAYSLIGCNDTFKEKRGSTWETQTTVSRIWCDIHMFADTVLTYNTHGKLFFFGLGVPLISRLEQRTDELENNQRISQATEADLTDKLEVAQEEQVYLQTELEEEREVFQEREQRLGAQLEDLQSELVALQAKLEQMNGTLSHEVHVDTCKCKCKCGRRVSNTVDNDVDAEANSTTKVSDAARSRACSRVVSNSNYNHLKKMGLRSLFFCILSIRCLQKRGLCV